MRTRLLRWSTVITGGILFGGFGGGCLPDGFLAGKASEILDVIFDAFVTGPLLTAAGVA